MKQIGRLDDPVDPLNPPDPVEPLEVRPSSYQVWVGTALLTGSDCT